MMFLTAKVDVKKIVIAVVAVLALILGLVALFSGGGEATQTAAAGVSDNNARVEFLKGKGWEVKTSPKESSQVRIPQSATDVYQKYNDLQKSQGYDLTTYAGKTVMRYVYEVTNFPNATSPVYATLLVYKNQIIGGDITDTAPQGQIRSLTKNS